MGFKSSDKSPFRESQMSIWDKQKTEEKGRQRDHHGLPKSSSTKRSHKLKEAKNESSPPIPEEAQRWQLLDFWILGEHISVKSANIS